MFVFEGESGVDSVVGFTDEEDLIDLSAYEIAGYRELNTGQAGNHVRIDLSEHGGGIVLLRNFDLEDLGPGDFLF